MIDLFDREAKKLSTGEHKFLEGLRASQCRLYEILEVKIDQGFELRDLWDDRRLFVRERAATSQLVAWDVIVGRIGPAGDGGTVFETLTHCFPAPAKDELLKVLRKAHRLYLREFPQKSLVAFFKTIMPLIRLSKEPSEELSENGQTPKSDDVGRASPASQ